MKKYKWMILVLFGSFQDVAHAQYSTGYDYSRFVDAIAKGGVQGIALAIIAFLVLFILSIIFVRRKQKPENNSNHLKVSQDENNPDFGDNKYYEQAWNEIESNQVKKGLWAKAFAHIGADNEETRALYIKFRVNELKEKVLLDEGKEA